MLGKPAIPLNAPPDISSFLGPSPFFAGLGWWCCGVGYCAGAWHLREIYPMLALGLLGLAPFVNLFCFFSGLSRLRRAWLRFATRRAARRAGLVPAWGSGLAGFFLVDEARGVCVVSGATIRFEAITGLECHSTFMAQRLVLRTDPAPRVRPHEIGFPTESALKDAAVRLAKAISTHRTEPVIPLLKNDDGDLVPLSPVAPTSDSFNPNEDAHAHC